MSLSLAPLEDLLDSLSLCYFVLIYFVTLYFRFIAECGASRLLEHVGQMDKIFKIPPPPGKTGVQSLRPLEENTPSPLAPVSQLGSVCFWCLCELGGALVETWRNSSDKFWLLRCCLFYSLRNVSSSREHAPYCNREWGLEGEAGSRHQGSDRGLRGLGHGFLILALPNSSWSLG